MKGWQWISGFHSITNRQDMQQWAVLKKLNIYNISLTLHMLTQEIIHHRWLGVWVQINKTSKRQKHTWSIVHAKSHKENYMSLQLQAPRVFTIAQLLLLWSTFFRFAACAWFRRLVFSEEKHMHTNVIKKLNYIIQTFKINGIRKYVY